MGEDGRVRVLLAPDSFTGTLTATQAAEAMADGWRAAAPHDELTLLPLSDGGPGFLDVLSTTTAGELVAVTTTDPLGREVPAAFLLVEDEGGPTAFVESAAAAGLHLLNAAERDPAVTSTSGVGRLLAAALDSGARRIVVGLGGSGTNDAGAGMLASLGAGDPDALGHGGLALGAVSADDLAGLREVQHRFAGVELVAATDVDNPLLGLQGASATFAAQKGASPELAQRLEGSLGRFTDAVGNALGPPRTDLLTGRPMRVEREPGAGAAGGLGYALMLLGARRRSGVEIVLEAVGFDGLLRDHDLVVTGEGQFDWQSLHGKVVAGVAEAALGHGTPTVVIAGQVLVGRRETMGLGIAGCYAVVDSPDRVDEAMTDPFGTLSNRTSRVAATWSPRRRHSDGT
jgi:glycerate kinase